MVSDVMRNHHRTPAHAGPPAAADALVRVVGYALAEWRGVSASERGVLVTTDCLYPDNAAVVVVVAGGTHGETVVVHDDAGAIDRLAFAGRTCNRASGILKAAARRFGLEVSDGAIASVPSPIADIGALIPLVANASQEAAHRLLEASAPVQRRDLPSEAAVAILAWRPDIDVRREQPVAGASSRLHRFDLFAPLRDGSTLLIDAVTPDSASVNAAVVANFDVGRRQDARFVRAIVFDPDMRDGSGRATSRFWPRQPPRWRSRRWGPS